MADSRLEEIFGRSINSAKELKKGIIDLQNSIKDLGANEEDLKKRSNELTYAQEEYNKMVNSAKQATDFAKDSILGMEKEYKNLYNTYKMLTEEQRNSDFGREMAASLEQLSNKLNDTKKNVGNFKDNIGRYSQGVMDAFNQMGISVGALQGPMKLAAGGAKTLGASLKSLIANPIGAVIMAIVVAFKALSAVVDQVKEAINNNEESQMRLKEAMSAFQPIIDGVKNAFDKLGQGVVTVIEWISKAVETIRKAAAAFTDFIGVTKGAKEGIEAQIEAYKGLAKAQNDYIKKQREVKVANAKDTARVEQLREEAAETDDVKEKTRLLTEAKEIQAEIDQRNIELAEENLRILQEEATHTANDAAANEALANALAAVEQARAQADKNARQFTRTIRSATGASNSHTDALKKEKEEVQKIIETLAENNKTEVQKLTEKYEKEKALLEKYHKDTTELTRQYNANMKKLQDEAAAVEEEKRKTIEQKRLADARAEFQAMENISSSSSSTKALQNAAFLAEQEYYILKYWLDRINGEIKELRKDNASLTSEQIDEALQSTFKMVSKENEVWLNEEIETYDKFLAVFYNALSNYNSKVKAATEAYAANEIKKAEYNTKVSQASNPFAEGTFEYYDIQKTLEDELLQKKIEIKKLELEDYTGTEEEKLAIRMEIIDLEMEAINTQAEREKALSALQKERNMNLLADTKTSLSGLASLTNGVKTLTEAELKNSNLDEREKKKKIKRLENLQKMETAVAVSSVVVDTASALMGIWRGYALEKVANAETAAATGPAAAATLAALNTKSLISALLQTAGIAATGVGQLAAIKGNHINGMASISNSAGGDGGASASATPSVNIDSSPYSYTRQLQTEEEEEQMNRPYYVSVTDINEVQNRVKVRDEESTY